MPHIEELTVRVLQDDLMFASLLVAEDKTNRKMQFEIGGLLQVLLVMVILAAGGCKQRIAVR